MAVELTARADKINCRQLILSLLQIDQVDQARLALEKAEELVQKARECNALEYAEPFIMEGRFVTARRIIEQTKQLQ